MTNAQQAARQDALAQLTTADVVDVVHFVQTNQIPIMSMGHFETVGLTDEDCRPTDLARLVARGVTVTTTNGVRVVDGI